MQSESLNDQLSRDQLSIDTPEQVSLYLPVSGIGSRALAQLVDMALQTAFYILVLILFALLAAPIGRVTGGLSQRGQTWLFGGFVLLNFLLLWGYFTFFEAFWNGQTPGKRLLKLRVIKDSGRRITLFEALTRNLLRAVDALPGCYAVGMVAMLISHENKRLGDLLAGTVVVHVSGESDAAALAPTALLAAPGAAASFPQDALARLSAEDLHLVESFSLRTMDLDHSTSERLSRQILERLCQRMQVEVPVTVSSRRALDGVAASLRNVLSKTDRRAN
ncbi:MAG: RDD family protein [Janthinobacterium lividum]